MVMTKLRNQTAEWHRHAERAVDLRARLASVVSYKEFLVRLYGFYLPYERAIHSGVSDGLDIDLTPRRKSPLLEADLRCLGASAEDIARLATCQWVPEITNTAAAAGSLYVTEGATLGGQIISRRLQRDLGITPISGGAFFTSYGSQLEAMWSEFGNAVERHCDTAAKQEEAIRAAICTFENFTRWFRAHRVGSGNILSTMPCPAPAQ